MESVAGFAWNQWQLCRGMAGSFRVESVAAFAWNTHPSISLLSPNPQNPSQAIFLPSASCA
jgi:hypothetical protein